MLRFGDSRHPSKSVLETGRFFQFLSLTHFCLTAILAFEKHIILVFIYNFVHLYSTPLPTRSILQQCLLSSSSSFSSWLCPWPAVPSLRHRDPGATSTETSLSPSPHRTSPKLVLLSWQSATPSLWDLVLSAASAQMSEPRSSPTVLTRSWTFQLSSKRNHPSFRCDTLKSLGDSWFSEPVCFHTMASVPRNWPFKFFFSGSAWNQSFDRFSSIDASFRLSAPKSVNSNSTT